MMSPSDLPTRWVKNWNWNPSYLVHFTMQSIAGCAYITLVYDLLFSINNEYFVKQTHIPFKDIFQNV